MSEELQAQNEPVEENNVEESPTSEERVEDSTPQTSSEPEAKVEEKPQEPKLSRSERRIKQLLDEKRALKEEVEKLGSPKETTLPWEKEQPMIDPNEEYIDPVLLEQRLQSRVQKEVQKALEQQRNIESYRQSVSEHERGLEDVLKSHPELDDQSDKFDPDLATEFIERYQDANYLPNGTFHPRRSPSEIAEKVLNMRERLVAKKTSEITGKLVKQATESAVSPRPSEPENENHAIDQLYQNAVSSGDDSDWAAYFKAASKK